MQNRPGSAELLQSNIKGIEPSVSARITVREGQFFPLQKIVTESRLSGNENDWREQLEEVGRKIQKDLGTRGNPVVLRRHEDDLQVRISNLTGSLLALSCQIDVVPKFISPQNEIFWPDILLGVLARARHKRYGYVKSSGDVRKRLKFIDHVALAYADSLERAFSQENIRVYTSKEEELPLVRGRLLVRKTLINALYRPNRYLCDVDYLDESNEYNSLLGWALIRFQSYVFDPAIKSRLLALEYEIPVHNIEYRLPLRLPLIPPSQYRHFDEPLEIASNLAMGNQYSVGGGKSSTYGYVINTEVMYEKYVEESLKYAVRLLRGSFNVYAQDSKLYAKSVTINDRSYYTRPDNVVYEGRTAKVLIDAKYKQFTDSESGSTKKPQNTDIYQLVASLFSHGCHIGVLLYPGMRIDSNVEVESHVHVWKVGELDSMRVIIGLSVDLSRLRDRSGIHVLDRELFRLLDILLNVDLVENRLEGLEQEINSFWGTESDI